MRKFSTALICALALLATGFTTSSAFACPGGKCKGKACKVKGKKCKNCKQCNHGDKAEGAEKAATPPSDAAPAAAH